MASDLLSTPPPLAPPKTQGEMVFWLRLIRSRRVGVATFFRLMKEHGTAEAALDALPNVAKSAGIDRYTPCPEDFALREMEAGQRFGATLISYACAQYPHALRDISDAPPLLWALGDLSLLNRPAVAMVGARNASSLGTRMARALASELGKTHVITSGLARGIDTAAHLAALDTGTIAVQAGGLDCVYPVENTALHDDIAKHGLRISEQPMGKAPHARDFPRRNRIISGVSQAVIIVEAAAKSGSLITAKDALDQGRDVLVVPGHPFDKRASGCNMLIRDGATLVRDARDVREAIGSATAAPPPQQAMTTKTPASSPAHNHGEAHAKILQLLGPTPVAEDQIIRDVGLPASAVLGCLMSLEMEGKVIRQAGGMLSRV